MRSLIVLVLVSFLAAGVLANELEPTVLTAQEMAYLVSQEFGLKIGPCQLLLTKGEFRAYPFYQVKFLVERILEKETLSLCRFDAMERVSCELKQRLYLPAIAYARGGGVVPVPWALLFLVKGEDGMLEWIALDCATGVFHPGNFQSWVLLIM